MPTQRVWPSLCYFHEIQTYWRVLHAQLLFWNLPKPDNKCGQYGQIFIYVPQKVKLSPSWISWTHRPWQIFVENHLYETIFKYEEIRRIYGQNLMYTLRKACLPLCHFLQKLKAHPWHCMEILCNKFHQKWMKNIDNTGKILIPSPN